MFWSGFFSVKIWLCRFQIWPLEHKTLKITGISRGNVQKSNMFTFGRSASYEWLFEKLPEGEGSANIFSYCFFCGHPGCTDAKNNLDEKKSLRNHHFFRNDKHFGILLLISIIILQIPLPSGSMSNHRIFNESSHFQIILDVVQRHLPIVI